MGAAIAILVAAVVVSLVTPLAIAIANRTSFYDHPYGYKGHRAPTPYLGGAAVMVGVIAAVGLVIALPLGVSLDSQLLVVFAGALALWALGTLDDRRPVSPRWRVLAETAVGAALWIAGAGFTVTGSAVVDFVLTVAWVVGVVNAVNLMDNLDGAASSVATACSAAIGAVALTTGQDSVAVVALALAGACAAFLPYNLAGPARIFLGDGGSMSIGLLVAALAMAVSQHAASSAGILGAALLVGVPILDTTLVVISRRRRRIPVYTAGRDHLSHRLLARFGSERRVALVLASAQAVLGAVAVIGANAGLTALVALAASCVVVGAGALWVLEVGYSRWQAPVSQPASSSAETG